MDEIKAIETEYAGVKFRSRLEARWALFFDALSIKWLYEYEGYKTPFGFYLPDFWLPEVYMRRKVYKGVLFEVKPENYVDDTHPALEYVANSLNMGRFFQRDLRHRNRLLRLPLDGTSIWVSANVQNAE